MLELDPERRGTRELLGLALVDAALGEALARDRVVLRAAVEGDEVELVFDSLPRPNEAGVFHLQGDTTFYRFRITAEQGEQENHDGSARPCAPVVLWSPWPGAATESTSMPWRAGRPGRVRNNIRMSSGCHSRARRQVKL